MTNGERESIRKKPLRFRLALLGEPLETFELSEAEIAEVRGKLTARPLSERRNGASEGTCTARSRNRPEKLIHTTN